MPEENFETLQALQVNTMETMKLQIDKELLSEIQEQRAKDKGVREILGEKGKREHLRWEDRTRIM